MKDPREGLGLGVQAFPNNALYILVHPECSSPSKIPSVLVPV